MMQIYLDHNASSPLCDSVREALIEHSRVFYGNPSSSHARGASARAALERAREQVATLLGVRSSEVVFTSGATEANNAAISGVTSVASEAGRHLLTTRAEHPSVLGPLARLEKQGWEVTRLAVDGDGRVDGTELEAALRDDTALVSLLWANNETGVIQDIEAISGVVKERGVLLHVDAVQAVGKLQVDLEALPIDLLSVSGHKIGAPMGIGCLILRDGVAFEAPLLGGTQERMRRAGTENLSGAIGLGVACEEIDRELESRIQKWSGLRDRLWQGIAAAIPEANRNGPSDAVLCNTLSVTFPGVDGAVLIEALDLEGIAVSSGSACASGSSEPSHVLLAMGRSVAEARSTLRLSLGHGVNEAQIDRVLEILPKVVARVREAVGHG